MSHPMMTSSSSSSDAMQPSAFIRSLVIELCEDAASTSFRPSGLDEDAEAAGRHSVPRNAAPRSSPPSSLLNAAWQRIARHNSINSMSCITFPKTSNTNTSSFLFYKRPIVSSPAASSAQLCDTFVVFEREGVVDADGGRHSDDGGPVADCNQVTATPLDSNAGDSTTAPVAESKNSSSDSHLTHGDVIFRVAFRGERRVFALNARDLMRSNRFVTHKTKIISIITCSTSVSQMFSTVCVIACMLTTSHHYHAVMRCSQRRQPLHAAPASPTAHGHAWLGLSSLHYLSLVRCNIH